MAPAAGSGRRWAHASGALALLLLTAACGVRHHDLIGERALDAARPDSAAPPDAATRDAAPPASDAGSGDAGQSGAGAASEPHVPSAHCNAGPCACDDGEDDDGDGLRDGLDPECTGAFDDDETSFGIGKPNKQNQCRDCFWDDNAGYDDGCRYPAECLTGSEPNGNGNCSSCDVSDKCVDSCRDRTPNGCDCFGCCEIHRPNGELLRVELSESCDLNSLDDAQACPRCDPSPACANPCGRCELCLGKRTADLPADCASGRPDLPAYRCEEGLRVCGSSADCVGASYCLLGCCLIDLL
jgi:hypothetical protein